MKRRGGSIIGLIIVLVIIVGIILFTIPYLKVNGDTAKIKRILYQTQKYMQNNGETRYEKLQERFFDDLDPEENISVEVLKEDFQMTKNGENYILKCRYVNENIIVPVLKIRMGPIDKDIETEEFSF
ncbi:hypothetical protein KAI78_00415 [bacterium]|nr:hypothetical protein [bacterium]MCK5598067.1 hypothetical protein [bacterium]